MIYCKVLVGILLLLSLENTSGREITRTGEIKNSEINKDTETYIDNTSETETEKNEIPETETEPTSEFILIESDLQNNPTEEDDLTNINATEIQDVNKIVPEMNTTSEDQTTEIITASEEQSSGNNASETDVQPLEIILATFVHELESNASEVIEGENDSSEPPSVTTLKEALDFFGSLIGAVSEFAEKYENKVEEEDKNPEAINESRFVRKEQIQKKKNKPLQTPKQKLKKNNVEKKGENTKTKDQEKNEDRKQGKNTEKLINQKNNLQILEVNEKTNDGAIENLIMNENPLNSKPLTNKGSNLEKLEEEAATDLFRIIWRANWSSSIGNERSEGTNHGCIGFGCREERKFKEVKLRRH